MPKESEIKPDENETEEALVEEALNRLAEIIFTQALDELKLRRRHNRSAGVSSD